MLTASDVYKVVFPNVSGEWREIRFFYDANDSGHRDTGEPALDFPISSGDFPAKGSIPRIWIQQLRQVNLSFIVSSVIPNFSATTIAGTLQDSEIRVRRKDSDDDWRAAVTLGVGVTNVVTAGPATSYLDPVPDTNLPSVDDWSGTHMGTVHDVALVNAMPIGLRGLAYAQDPSTGSLAPLDTVVVDWNKLTDVVDPEYQKHVVIHEVLHDWLDEAGHVQSSETGGQSLSAYIMAVGGGSFNAGHLRRKDAQALDNGS